MFAKLNDPMRCIEFSLPTDATPPAKSQIGNPANNGRRRNADACPVSAEPMDGMPKKNHVKNLFEFQDN